MAAVSAFLKHSYIRKDLQAEPYTARAHSRYVQRQSAAQYVYWEHMPDNYNARQRWFYDYENQARKNGRLIDKFVIAVPHGISQEHAIETIRRFGQRIGQGQCPFLFSIHGFDSTNHHAHMIFIDRDVTDHKRVFGTAQRNATAQLKLEWERVANEVFEELGYDIRVKVKDWNEEQANDNVPEPVTVSEDEELSVIQRDHPDTVSKTAAAVRMLHSAVTELNRLHDAQTRLRQAQERYANLYHQRENAQLASSAYSITSQAIHQSAYAAEERLSHHQKGNGKLKGLRVSLFGYEIKTAARKEAEQALRVYEQTHFAAEHAKKTQDELVHNVSVLSAQATAAEKEAFMRQSELEALYGSDEDIAKAEQALENTKITNAKEIDLDEAVEALLTDEITPDEFEAYLIASGQEAVLEAYRDVMQEKGQEQEL